MDPDELEDSMRRILRWSIHGHAVVEDDSSDEEAMVEDGTQADTGERDDDENAAAPQSPVSVDAGPPGSSRSLQRSAARQSLTRRRSYPNSLKLELIEAAKVPGANITALAEAYNVKGPSAIHNWLMIEDRIRSACNNRRSRTTLGGQGRHVIFKREDEIVQWIKEMRREDFPLKTVHVAQYIKEDYKEWANAYLASRKEDSLHLLTRRLIMHHGFSFRMPSRSVLTFEQLMEEQVDFASTTGALVRSTYNRDCIFNSDEAAVYYDESPGLIIAARGARKSSKVAGNKQSARVTVLLTVSASGQKLAPLIIFKAKPGGTIEDSFDDYPAGAYYAAQSNTWMDADVWRDTFIKGQWEDYVSAEDREPLAIYVDSFKTHVSPESLEAFAAHGTEVVPLPTNTTAILQPLDVGVMGPFKKKLRSGAIAAELSMLTQDTTVPLRQRLLMQRKMPADGKRRVIAEKVIAAWNSVSVESIRRAWAKSGLVDEA